MDHNVIVLLLEGSSPSLRPKCSSEVEKPCVLFTGIVYQEGENIVRELGGLLVDSVYECTHLVTDKVSCCVMCIMLEWCGVTRDGKYRNQYKANVYLLH